VAETAKWAGRGRFAGLLAAFAIGGAAVLAPGSAVAAEPSSIKTDDKGRPSYGTVSVPRHKLPANAVPTTRTQPKLGAHGPAFQPAPKKGTPRPNVVGGTPANAADHRSVVGLESYFAVPNNSGGFDWYISTCTGTVLSPTKVLTAAHCVTDLALGTTFVIAGRSVLSEESSGFVTQAASTWTHQGYNLANQLSNPATMPVNDVSVVTLKQALPAAYTPIVFDDAASYAADTQASVVGYGLTATGAGDTGVLRKADLPIKSDAACGAAMAANFDATRMLCAGVVPNGANTCGGDSGGPILVNGKQAGITSWGSHPCGRNYSAYSRISYFAATIREDLTRATVNNLDWTGDGHADLFGRLPSGELALYSGAGFADDGRGGFAGTGYTGEGWGIYSKVFRVNNWTRDGKPAIMGVQPNGQLFLHKGTGTGGFDGARVAVGTGWTMFSDIMVTNNWLSDGRPNLMGRTPSGDLFLYTSDGAGGWLNGGVGIKIGTGWNMFNTVLTPGEWQGDGRQALIGRTPSGDLLLYKSNGAGGWLNGGVGVKIGTGWNMFSIFMSPGDWNGDNMVDLIGITPAGVMFLYRTNGAGVWLNGFGQQIGSGWNGFNAIF
jgi:V8-like Glu-specific endopeptidase